MLKSAFNAMINLRQPRTVILRRPYTVDLYSPMKMAPSNYSKYREGIESVAFHSLEFVVTSDSLLGQFSQLITFSGAIDAGQYKLKYGSEKTSFLDKTATAASIQTALRLLTGLSQITISGNYASGFSALFQGFSALPAEIEVTDSTIIDVATDPITATVARTYTPWAKPILRGDKIIDGTDIHTITTVEVMSDIGGAIMGFRVQCE